MSVLIFSMPFSDGLGVRRWCSIPHDTQARESTIVRELLDSKIVVEHTEHIVWQNVWPETLHRIGTNSVVVENIEIESSYCCRKFLLRWSDTAILKQGFRSNTALLKFQDRGVLLKIARTNTCCRTFPSRTSLTMLLLIQFRGGNYGITFSKCWCIRSHYSW